MVAFLPAKGGVARMKRVLFVSTGLATGGAEKQLVRLLGVLTRQGVDASVVALQGGPVSEEIGALGVPVQIAGLFGVGGFPKTLRKLVGVTRAFRPDIVQGWMYHGNLAASLVGRWAAPNARIVWGVRQALYEFGREKWSTRWVIRASARVSARGQTIVYNSDTARAQHEVAGFAAAKGHVIDNGFDVDRFQPDPAARITVRETLGLAEQTPLIGLIARYHPMKGHDVFLRAAAQVAQRWPEVHFVLVGREVVPENPALSAYCGARMLAGRVHYLGERQDIPSLTASLDIASSSSWGEAFSNSVGEAMTCGVPVVATDVGDVRRIVGDAGIVVPVGDAAALAQAWDALLSDPCRRKSMGEAGRRRVEELFSVAVLGERYLALYRDLLDG